MNATATTFRTLAEINADLDAIDYEQVEAASECLAEIRNEAALFGDSGPGSGEIASDCRRFLTRYEGLVRELWAAQAAAAPALAYDGPAEPF